MVTPRTAKRLRWHAGLAGPPAEAAVPSVSDCTSPGSPVAGSLAKALADFLDAISTLNHELNGPVPSEVRERKTDDVPMDVAYAVAEVAWMLRSSGGDAWSVDTAWLAVLVGDIDDVGEHLAEERWASGGRERQ